MNIKNKRSIIYLFLAMLISSVVIGSFCQTEFRPVVKNQTDALTKPLDSSTAKHSARELAVKDKQNKKYLSVDVNMELKQVGEHSYYVQGANGIATDNKGFISNAGVVITDEGVVIFDALGSPSLAWKLVQKIRSITDKPIIKVVMSHYHADHIYGLQVFKDLGAEIIAPDGVYEYIDSDGAKERLEERRLSLDPWVNDKTYIVKPDTILDKGKSFTLGGVHFTINMIGPAHSDGDMTLYVENDRVLFSGDIIFEGRVPFLGNKNTKRWLETLQKLDTEKLRALVPGHGPAAKEPAKALTLTRDYLAFMREKMASAVEDLTEFDEAYKAIDWSRFQSLPAFNEANRKNAFQVYLSLEAEGI